MLWVVVVARGIFIAIRDLWSHMDCLVLACGLSCSLACRILVPWPRIEPLCGLLTTGPMGKPLPLLLLFFNNVTKKKKALLCSYLPRLELGEHHLAVHIPRSPIASLLFLSPSYQLLPSGGLLCPPARSALSASFLPSCIFYSLPVW